MNIVIEPVKTLEHIMEAMALVKRVFMEFEAPDYEQKGIDFFLDYINENAMEQRIKNGEIAVWSATVDYVLVGVVAMRPPNALSLLFVDRDWHRKGIARRMFEHALAYQKNDAPVTVNSSPYAVEAYRRIGFTETGPEETAFGMRFQPMVYTKQKPNSQFPFHKYK